MPDADVLSDLSFNVLVALRGEVLHGYALVKRLRDLEGRARLRTGTVYAALARLEEQGLVTETQGPADADDDARRRYYTATAEGVATARREARRLADMLDLARGKALLGTDRG